MHRQMYTVAVQLKVRRATNTDIPEVVRVIRAVYDEYSFPWEPEGYHADLYDLETHYDQEGDFFYVAELNGEVIGTAALEVFPPVPGASSVESIEGYWRVSGADCSLERLYVHPDYRRVGAGRALLDHVIEQATNLNRARMELWSDKKFLEAHRLYEGYGAVVVGERLCDDPDQSPEWGLRIDLVPKAQS